MRSHPLIDELRWRGLLHQHTQGVDVALRAGPVSGYIGFDPTAPSLHVGSLRQIMLLVHLQNHANTPIALVGGGTGLIGDPKAAGERPLASLETIATNAAALWKQLGRFLDLGTARMINNAEWLLDLRAVDFMRDVGKHFTVNYMLQKDSVQTRMAAGISYTEFSYMLLQACDFLELHRRHGVTLQMGGSDQWGNITAGIELIRRTTGHEAHAITSPLVTTSAGTKFGKTEAGAIWLDATMTSPYQFYQFWINVDDRDVGPYLRGFTLLPHAQIETIDAETAAHPERRKAQQTLARDVTERVHGVDVARGVIEASALLFGGDVVNASRQALEVLRGEIPCLSVAHWPLPLDEFLQLITSGATPLFRSKGEARRTIQQGGLYVNGERIKADEPTVSVPLLHGRFALVRRGARNYSLIEKTG